MSKQPPPPYDTNAQKYELQPTEGSAPPPQQGYAYPPPHGSVALPQQYGMPPQQGYPPYQTTNQVIVTQQQQQVHQSQPVQVQQVVMGGCPACRAGVLTREFTCCGICLGIWCFPCGLICCFAMRERRCTSCQAKF